LDVFFILKASFSNKSAKLNKKGYVFMIQNIILIKNRQGISQEKQVKTIIIL
jgi:hypothetical protein